MAEIVAEEKRNFGIGVINIMAKYPKVKSVTPLSGKQLCVTFVTGDTKVYDCTPLLKELPFYPLLDDAFFKNVHVDETGYGIVWNDNVDLSESELWIHGKAEPCH